MAEPTKTIHFCPDEWAGRLNWVLEDCRAGIALHSYKDTNDGRRLSSSLVALIGLEPNWKTVALKDCTDSAVNSVDIKKTAKLVAVRFQRRSPEDG